MKRIKLFLFIIFSIFLLPATHVTAFQGDIPEGILTSFRNGNAAGLSRYFHANIELTVGETEGIYSKDQAELIVRDFFVKNIPESFAILHKGGQEGSRYGIGTLVTASGTFRVTLLIKLSEAQPQIHRLRIEKENGQ